MPTYGKIKDLFEKHQIPAPSISAEVGSGWISLIDDMFTRLIAAGWDKKVDQIKSKFCELRVYIDKSDPALDAIITEAENRSRALCEHCGQPHNLIVPRLGIALCPSCDEQHINKLKELYNT